ncbi:MAG: thioredoxin family protein [Anaerolinea sp.]|nr:thioredoxin family protein [Anaerolinea sp.]
MSLANQFSYVLMSALAVVIILASIRMLTRPRPIVLTGIGAALVLAALGLFLLLRPGTSDVDNLQAAEQILNNGQPTLVEFFSNYCAGCMGVRPVVDALVDELKRTRAGTFNVLRVDIHTGFGQTLSERYGFSFTPEFILLNGDGEEVWRGHAPPSVADIDRLIPAREA